MPVDLETLVGQVVDGKYRVERLLGQGGMGAVFRAVHEGTSRTVRVEIDILPETGKGDGDPGSRPPLIVGMSADIEVILDEAKGVVSVPTLVVLEGEAGKSVYVVEGGRLRLRHIEVGLSNWDRTEIRSGLKEGDLVVIPTDRRKLIEGQAVRTEVREESRRP